MKAISIDHVVLTHNSPGVAPWLEYIAKHKDPEDRLLVIDDMSTSENVAIYKKFANHVFQHKLEGDYSAHRNFILPKLKGTYAMFTDDDEVLTEPLFKGLKTMLANTGYADLYAIPRLNLFTGATPMDALKYNWDLQYIDGCPVINWGKGDRQTRLFKCKRGLKWTNKLHEIIMPGKEHRTTILAMSTQHCIEHRKTINEQRADNDRYNANWTPEENKSGGSYQDPNV